MCNFKTYRLQVELPKVVVDIPPGAEDPNLPATVASAIREAYAHDTPALASNDAMLFLSGGSQEGAFGAGVLDRWHTVSGGAFPSFRVVTGISTGALLATPAFIGRTDLLIAQFQQGRRLWSGYEILRENELLQPLARGAGRGFDVRTALSALRHGAVANLTPLRQVLLEQLGEREFEAVAAGYRNNRLLLVGVVDVDTGEAVALDLTELALRITGSQSDEDRRRLRGCYADAIVASSSAPLAATPVFIDNRMYVDGGARFGLFSNEIDQAFADRAKDTTAPEYRIQQRLNAAQIYVIVNGNLAIRQQCGRPDTAQCNVPGTRYGAHPRWNLMDLAIRSEGILVNQNQRMSLERVNLMSMSKGPRFHPAWIGAAAPTHLSTMGADQAALGAGEMSCADWRAMDEHLLHPIQFHPREMHCLVHYGRWFFDHNLNWDRPGQSSEVAAVPAKL